MEHEQTNEAPRPAHKPAKKKAKKRAAPAVAARPAPKPSADFEGITPADCPAACTADRCVISGRGICSHPFKGGLQAMLQNPDSLRRLSAAKRALGKRKLELRDDE